MTRVEKVDCRWRWVTCADCGVHYQCTPEQDYFESTTLEDGLCWGCLMKATGMRPQPEPPYLDGP